MPAKPVSREVVRWRPWPCAGCSGGASAVDFLVGRHGPGGAVPRESEDAILDEIIERERDWLIEWVACCPHRPEQTEQLLKLDEGSEHAVYLAADERDVFKLTLPGTYGDTYALIAGRVHQFRCTPGEYLVRAGFVQKTFGFAPLPFGLTSSGLIISSQQFVKGDPPTQSEADEFLMNYGFEPVKRNCWLWKKSDIAEGVDIWVGDARSDNFVKAPLGIVPIDLRMWATPIDRPSLES